MQLKKQNEAYRVSLALAETERFHSSQTCYPPEVDDLLKDLKADLDKKDDRIISLTKELCDVKSKLQVSS